MQIGAQLFTMRDFIKTERDMEYTFEKVAKMGYKTAQLSGISEYDPKVVRAIADKNDLKIVLTHTPQDRVLKETEKVIETHAILGAEYVGIGSLPGIYRDAGFIYRFAEDYMEAAQKIKDAGMYFMYHNHDFEFEKVNGKFIMDVLAETMPAELMGFTLDTYWLQAGGVSVLEWIEKLQDRIPCVHFKDMAIVKREKLMYPVGEGNLNFKDIIAKLNELGKTKYALVEQDNCNGDSPFNCLQTSYNNLKALGCE